MVIIFIFDGGVNRYSDLSRLTKTLYFAPLEL